MVSKTRDYRENTIEQKELNQTWIEYKEHQEDIQLNDKNEPFRVNCYYCSEKFLSVEERFLHERACKIGRVRRFSCKVCSINFRSKLGLRSHEKRHKKPGGFSCWICDAKFTSITDRMQHKDAEHRFYSCQICEAKFRGQSEYIEHIVEVHRNGSRVNDDNVEITEIDQGKLKQLIEGDEISITHTIHISDESQSNKNATEQLPDVVIVNGKDYQELKNLRNGMKEKRNSPNEFSPNSPKQSAKDFINLNDDLLLFSRSDSKVVLPREEYKRKEKSSSKPKDFSDNDFCDDSDVSDSHFESSNLDMNTQEEDKEEIKSFDTEYRCEFCPQIYCYEELYLLHLKNKHGIEKENETKHESKETEKETDKETNEMNETAEMDNDDDDMFQNATQNFCRYCKKHYPFRPYLIKHEKLHGPNGKLRVRCFRCNKIVEDKQELKEHNKKFHPKVKMTCAHCSKTYFSKHSLVNHIELKHMKKEIQKKRYYYLCGKCGKNLTTKTSLVDHEKSNCGRSPIHQCDICKKFYHSAGSLKTHKKIHTNELPYSCKYCGKGIRTLQLMKQHERVHTGKKPYKCTYCPKAFSHKDNVLNHITSIHEGYKRYMCSGCGQRFSCISGLLSHRKSYANTCGLVPNCTKPIGPGHTFRHADLKVSN